MTRRIIIMMFVAVFAAAVPGAVLADEYGMSDYGVSNAQRAAESVNTVDADMWPAGGQVDTGAVPGGKSEPSLIDTHFDPFHPELREIDRVGSTGG